jgi:hypothetical protein
METGAGLTKEVLRGAGLSDHDIATLVADRVVE